jgi:hypothetical protein
MSGAERAGTQEGAAPNSGWLIRADVLASALIAVILVGVPLTWYFRLGLFFVAVAISADLLRRIDHSTPIRIALMLVASIVLAAGFLP